MNCDRFGASHSNSDTPALRAYESAVEALLRHRPVLPSLSLAMALEPEMPAALLLRGFCNVLLARQETLAQAREDAREVARLLAGQAARPRDLMLAEALKHAAFCESGKAIAILMQLAEADPGDVLVVKLAHILQFMAGRGAEMAAFTGRILARLGKNSPGHGFIMGCHAFGLEETGHYREAEAFAQSALHSDVQDLWAMHALAHVYEMKQLNREGILWIQSARDLWQDAPNFGYHLAWHLALFNFNIGRYDRALAIYDDHVRRQLTDDFRDIANAVSLLWRLRQQGVATGDRFGELADVARHRRRDMSLVFASLHHLLSLAATGDLEGAEDLCANLKSSASGGGTQAQVARDIGLPLARIVLAFARGVSVDFDAAALVRNLPELGGSHAQRDVFVRTLAMIAAESGDKLKLGALMDYRRSLRREDEFVTLVETLAVKHGACGTDSKPTRRIA